MGRGDGRSGGWDRKGGRENALLGVVREGVGKVRMRLVQMGLLLLLLLAGTGRFRLMVVVVVMMGGRLVDWNRRVVDGVQQDVAVVWGGDRAGDVRLLLLHVRGERFQMQRARGHLLMVVCCCVV